MNKILAFETSCDDTSVAIVDDKYKVHANLISSQLAHSDFGGVVPEIASRLHIKNIMRLTGMVLENSGTQLSEISAVAVSINPGLIGALLVGLSFAKGLAYSLGKPLIAINHMLGHVYANKIDHPELEPPYLALVVSGGHTELVNFRTELNFQIVGRTRDDAAGEAFDKAAKLLGLGYPGGPVLERTAAGGNPDFVILPRAMKGRGNFDFSFSGFKTAVRNYLQGHDDRFVEEHLADIAASVQKAIVEVLVNKTIAYGRQEGLKRIIVAGGVSANRLLRSRIRSDAEKIGAKVYFPSLQYCMDNAAMIGAAAVNKFRRGEFADLDLNAFSTKGLRRL